MILVTFIEWRKCKYYDRNLIYVGDDFNNGVLLKQINSGSIPYPFKIEAFIVFY